MAAHTSGTQIRLKNITKYLSLVTPLLDDLCDAFGSPLLKAISTITRSFTAEAETIKRNKEDCIRLMDGSVLPPATLSHLGDFVKTLQKIHTYIEAQQDAGRIKRFFHQNATRTLLRGCETDLQQALVVFQVQNGVGFWSGINEMQKNMQEKHEEMLALISACSTRASSINGGFASSASSSNSFSLLPAAPKIFHGRDTELNQVLDILAEPSARVAILGAGGIGKTSLAKVFLHHPTTVERYQNNRFFVSCDSVTTQLDLASLIASHLGLKLGSAGNAIKKVVQHFSEGPPCLLVLDNLETAWEPLESRADIEEFLSLLTDVPHLALIITMRGAERPAKPLTQEAARQTFLDITDDVHDPQDIDKLLALTDNLALAVDLIARLVDYEGCATVLSRWAKEKTQLLSESHNKTKTTSLEVSIVLSLHSPRVSSLPGTKALLSLLSVLPDGISDTDLRQSAPEIPDMLASKTALLRTSLAYLNYDGQLKNILVLALKSPRDDDDNDPAHAHLEQAVACALLFGRVCHFSGRGRNVVMEYIPGDIDPQFSALDLLSWINWRLGNYHNARKYASEAAALAAASGDMHAEARARRMGAVACTSLGAFRDGVQLCCLARSLLDRCGHGSQTEAHNVLMKTEAELHMYKSEYAEARQIHVRIVHEVSKEHSPYNYALALQNIAMIDVMIGGEAQGISIATKLDEAGAIFNKMGHPTGIFSSDIIQADLALREGNTSSARSQFEKCLNLAWRKNDEFVAVCLQRLGDSNLWHPEEDIDWTCKWPIIFIIHALQSKSKLEIHEALRCLGNMFSKQGNQDTAHGLFTVALDEFTEMDVHRGRADCMLWLGDISRQRGDLHKAVELWTAARPLFERSFQLLYHFDRVFM
ncbi:hypothetical protein B0H12DRAFT_1236529 [Mycena haematopus]|nr:hypothetical protein B0H12DRAFT_1236529 [Mycena haematopus]